MKTWVKGAQHTKIGLKTWEFLNFGELFTICFGPKTFEVYNFFYNYNEQKHDLIFINKKWDFQLIIQLHRCKRLVGEMQVLGKGNLKKVCVMMTGLFLRAAKQGKGRGKEEWWGKMK